jgi:FecR protein
MKKGILIGLLLMVCMQIGIFAKEDNNAAWSATQMGMIFKFERQRDDVLARIRNADETILKAQNLISRAQAADNAAAETIANRALQTAQETKHQYALKQVQIEKNIVYVRNRMADKSGMDMKIGGIITQHTGRVQYTSGKPPYETMSLEGDRAGYLEEGDSVLTYGNSSAEIQFLDGRGTLKIGEYSSVKVDKKDATTESLSLVKGKIHVAVEKAEAFGAWVDEKAQRLGDDPMGFSEAELKGGITKLKNYSKKFEVRTPAAICAVRGTTFTVTTNEAGETVVEMIEGSVDVTNLKTTVVSSVKGGEKITIGMDGSAVIEASRIEPSRVWWEQ